MAEESRLLLPVPGQPVRAWRRAALPYAPWLQSTGTASPRSLKPGQVLLVTVNDVGASVWALGLGGGLEQTPFARDAIRAWGDAAAALTRSLSILPGLEFDREAPAGAVRLDSLPRLFASWRPEPVLDGPSFGLAFLLSLASIALKHPLIPDIAAAATVDPEGAVGPVDGLRDKVEALLSTVPGLSKVLVAASQADDAQTYANAIRPAVRVVGVADGTSAIKEAFKPNPLSLLVKRGRTANIRSAIVLDVFRLATSGRTRLAEWHGVAEAAARARRWTGLTRDQDWMLRFSEAVALRHHNNSGRLPPWPATRQRALPIRLRLSVAAHYISQATDTGHPSAPAAERIARRYRVPLTESFSEHLKVHGALARLLAVSGRPREALRLQQAIVETQFASSDLADATRQFSEWYRLSGALEDGGAFSAADAACSHAAGLADWNEGSRAFITLSRARAQLMLGIDQDEAHSNLEMLTANKRLGEHIRSSALRWLVRDLPPSSSQRANATFRREKFRHLADMDLALATHNESVARVSLNALKQLEPGLIGHLIRASSGETGLARLQHIVRFYPY